MNPVRLPATLRRRLWRTLTAAALAGILAFAGLWVRHAPPEVAGTVIRIADGDTLTVLDAGHHPIRVRILGIDAPEKQQPFGERARQSLAELAFNQVASLSETRTDRYGRTVAKVEVNGRDIGLEQIRRGYAWHYKAYERDQPREDRTRYADAERSAKQQRAGLWLNATPTPPWDWRKARRESE